MIDAPDTLPPGPWHACKDGDCLCGMVWANDGKTHLATAHHISQASKDDLEANELYPQDREITKAVARAIAAIPEREREIERLRRAEADARDVVYQCQAEIERLQLLVNGECPGPAPLTVNLRLDIPQAAGAGRNLSRGCTTTEEK